MRDRDDSGRPRNARPRDELGRPLEPGATGVAPLPDDIDPHPGAVVSLATELLDRGLPFQAHEVLETAWKDSEPPARAAWQGMAQLAVALTHALRMNPSGARRLRQRARANLTEGQLPSLAEPLRERLEDELGRALEP